MRHCAARLETTCATARSIDDRQVHTHGVVSAEMVQQSSNRQGRTASKPVNLSQAASDPLTQPPASPAPEPVGLRHARQRIEAPATDRLDLFLQRLAVEPVLHGHEAGFDVGLVAAEQQAHVASPRLGCFRPSRCSRGAGSGCPRIGEGGDQRRPAGVAPHGLLVAAQRQDEGSAEEGVQGGLGGVGADLQQQVAR